METTPILGPDLTEPRLDPVAEHKTKKRIVLAGVGLAIVTLLIAGFALFAGSSQRDHAIRLEPMPPLPSPLPVLKTEADLKKSAAFAKAYKLYDNMPAHQRQYLENPSDSLVRDAVGLCTEMHDGRYDVLDGLLVGDQQIVTDMIIYTFVVACPEFKPHFDVFLSNQQRLRGELPPFKP